jgi:hypothetical protein
MHSVEESLLRSHYSSEAKPNGVSPVGIHNPSDLREQTEVFFSRVIRIQDGVGSLDAGLET